MAKQEDIDEAMHLAIASTVPMLEHGFGEEVGIILVVIPIGRSEAPQVASNLSGDDVRNIFEFCIDTNYTETPDSERYYSSKKAN